MPGCRDSDISVFCCAEAGKADSARPSAAMAPAQLRHIILFIERPPAVESVDLSFRRCTNALVHLMQAPSLRRLFDGRTPSRLPPSRLPPYRPAFAGAA